MSAQQPHRAQPNCEAAYEQNAAHVEDESRLLTENSYPNASPELLPQFFNLSS